MFEGVPSLDEINSDADESLYGVRLPAQTEVAGQIYEKDVSLITLSGITYKVRRHPEVLIVQHVDDWIDDYRYTSKYKIPIPFEDRHPCWIDLEKEYEYIVREMSDGNKNN